jgi:hypothetical protein
MPNFKALIGGDEGSQFRNGVFRFSSHFSASSHLAKSDWERDVPLCFRGMPLVKQPGFFFCISFLLFLAQYLADGMVPSNDSPN